MTPEQITIDAGSFEDGGMESAEFALKSGFSVTLINTDRNYIAQVNTLSQRFNARPSWNSGHTKCHLRLQST